MVEGKTSTRGPGAPPTLAPGGLAFAGAEVFGAVSAHHDLDGVLAFIRGLTYPSGNEPVNAAAYGMALVAALNVKAGSSFYEGRATLDQLSRAKAELDIALGHDVVAVGVTGNLLTAAQRYVDSAIVPCTEWASTEEIFEVVCRCAVCEAGPDVAAASGTWTGDPTPP